LIEFDSINCIGAPSQSCCGLRPTFIPDIYR
jgi:hypothetical protein